MIIRPNQVIHEWPFVSHWIEKAMMQSVGETATDLLAECMRDRAHLWKFSKGAAITRVYQGPPRILQVVALGGSDKDTWISSAVQEWQAFAKNHNCDFIFATGRPGWKKDFARHGFKVEKITGVCEVQHA